MSSKSRHENLSWGRTGHASWGHVMGVLFIVTTTPVMVFYFFLSIDQYGGKALDPIFNLFSGEEDIWLIVSKLPRVSLYAFYIGSLWFMFQVFLFMLPDILHYIVPKYKGGIHFGPVTPAGHILPYNINGLQAWFISNALFLLNGFYFEFFTPTIIVDNFGGLLWAAVITGNIIAILAYIKAIVAPTHAKDRKFTGSVLYDIVMGVELNPRFGKMFDLKLFLNGRPGIAAWTIINMSYAWKQYELYGHVTNSMLLVNYLHGLYVVDFFWNEAWYLHTIDICHDHFGWYYGFGDMAWLPWMYTLQGHFLVYNPNQLSQISALLIFTLGTCSYLMFRSVNSQKDKFKQSDGNCLIWGKKATYIPAEYLTSSGERKGSKLLTSGWWGVARHMNYTADLVGALCYGLACGSKEFIPFFYFVFLLILLVHRCLRDEDRCKAKYGKSWNVYTSKVKYRLIPYLF
ncbi:7-dehydrocholesterol reductase-like isoform X2 [Convolutriloba macropyga]|uniref:7-dehydrocholesterol reductase-like isoform X2 n=1 Tax=Convolutriloba macropyga TaxID=536237 RepID=UPI003F51CB0B